MEARGRAHTKAQEYTRAVSIDPHANQVKDQIIDDHVEDLFPAQYPEGFIVALVFYKARAKMTSFIDALIQAGVVPVAPTISQAVVEVQTSTSRTSQQHIIAARLVVMRAIASNEQKRLERFQRLYPSHIDGDASDDAHDILVRYHQMGRVQQGRLHYILVKRGCQEMVADL